MRSDPPGSAFVSSVISFESMGIIVPAVIMRLYQSSELERMSFARVKFENETVGS